MNEPVFQNETNRFSCDAQLATALMNICYYFGKNIRDCTCQCELVSTTL